MALRCWLCLLQLATLAALPGLPSDKYDLLETQVPQLAAELKAWWGEDVYNRSVEQIQLDLMQSGYDSRASVQDSIVDALSFVAESRRSAAPCSNLPVALEGHAWRYQADQLRRCLGKGSRPAAWNCTLSCQALPGVSLSLQCARSGANGSWALSGLAPEGECRHLRDTEAVETTGGSLRGLLRPILQTGAEANVSVALGRTFWGIPYAEPPRRFDVPKALSKWNGTRDSEDYYAKGYIPRTHCVGLPPLDNGKGSEDCLYLDIYVPPGATTVSPLPVMVFLFGGGFIAGDAWQSGHMDGIQFAVRNSVILVVVSFRAGFLGQWGHPSLVRSDGSVGNYGQLDQRMALQWLQANVRSFGGDPGSITLAGHSSGAFGIGFHLMSPGSRGLFSAVITESASWDSGWYFVEKASAFTFYAQVGEAMGCPQDAPGSQSKASLQMQCLLSLPQEAFYNFSNDQISALLRRVTSPSKARDAWKIIEAVLSTLGRPGGFQKTGLGANDTNILATPLWPALPAGIIVDGSDSGLPAAPRRLFESGRVQDVPIWMNLQQDEGTLFAALLVAVYPWYKSPSLTHSAIDSMIKWVSNADENFTATLLQLYPHGWDMDAPFYRISRLIQDNVFFCSTRRFARALSARRPGRLFYGEETYVGSLVKSSSVASAILHEDVAWFLGAHHCENPRWILGPNGAWNFWADDDQQMLNIVNCHYARMLHCQDPGASPDGPCRRNLQARGVRLEACEAPGGDRAFPSYSPDSGVRREIHPLRDGNITPSEEEVRICETWDAAPPDVFVGDSCHGCAQKAPREAAVFV